MLILHSSHHQSPQIYICAVAYWSHSISRSYSAIWKVYGTIVKRKLFKKRDSTSFCLKWFEPNHMKQNSQTTPVKPLLLNRIPRQKENEKNKHTYALMAYFLFGKCRSFFLCFSVFKEASCLDRRLRIARVFLGRRSRGTYFLFL